MLSLYCKQARDNDAELRTKILLGSNDLILQTKKASETKYTNQPLDLFGSIPEFNNELMWPLGKLSPSILSLREGIYFLGELIKESLVHPPPPRNQTLRVRRSVTNTFLESRKL